MTRYEFISQLRDSLAGEIPQSAAESNIRYYEQYIDGELSKGRTEADILRELGDPRLIARTIIDTWQSSDTSSSTGSGYSGEYGSDAFERFSGYSQEYGDRQGPRSRYTSGYDSSRQSSSRTGRNKNSTYINFNGHHIDLNKWYIKAIPIVIIALIVLSVACVLLGFVRMILYVLTSPIFWIIVVVLCVAGFFLLRRR